MISERGDIVAVARALLDGMTRRHQVAVAWGISVGTCGSGCEQSVLLGSVQRQIEFRQTRRGELDRLPALQDRLDHLRA